MTCYFKDVPELAKKLGSPEEQIKKDLKNIEDKDGHDAAEEHMKRMLTMAESL